MATAIISKAWTCPSSSTAPPRRPGPTAAPGPDGKTDSAFTTMVLEIEQQELDACAHKARIIISKSGEVLSYDQYRALMDKEG